MFVDGFGAHLYVCLFKLIISCVCICYVCIFIDTHDDALLVVEQNLNGFDCDQSFFLGNWNFNVFIFLATQKNK